MDWTMIRTFCICYIQRRYHVFTLLTCLFMAFGCVCQSRSVAEEGINREQIISSFETDYEIVYEDSKLLVVQFTGDIQTRWFAFENNYLADHWTTVFGSDYEHGLTLEQIELRLPDTKKIILSSDELIVIAGFDWQYDETRVDRLWFEEGLLSRYESEGMNGSTHSIPLDENNE